MWLCKQCKCLHSIRPTLRPQCWQQQQQQQQSNNQPGKNKKSNHLGQFIQAGNEGGKQKLKSTGEATVHNTTTTNNNIQTINQEKLKSNLPVAVVQGGRKKKQNQKWKVPKTKNNKTCEKEKQKQQWAAEKSTAPDGAMEEKQKTFNHGQGCQKQYLFER